MLKRRWSAGARLSRCRACGADGALFDGGVVDVDRFDAVDFSPQEASLVNEAVAGEVVVEAQLQIEEP